MISCSTFYRNYVSALYRIRDTKVIAPRTEDRGRITKQPSVCFPMSIGGLEQKCFQLTMKSSGRPQQLQLCRQRVACSRCGDRESRVADSSTCPRHDEVTRRQSTQCRSSNWAWATVSPTCTRACVQEATCAPSGTTCTGSFLRLVTCATLGEPGSRTVARSRTVRAAAAAWRTL